MVLYRVTISYYKKAHRTEIHVSSAFGIDTLCSWIDFGRLPRCVRRLARTFISNYQITLVIVFKNTGGLSLHYTADFFFGRFCPFLYQIAIKCSQCFWQIWSRFVQVCRSGERKHANARTNMSKLIHNLILMRKIITLHCLWRLLRLYNLVVFHFALVSATNWNTPSSGENQCETN